MRVRGASCDVSLRFLGSYIGGYGISLPYRLSIESVPIVVVHAIGLATGAVGLIIALRLRGSVVRPDSWTACG